MCLTSLLQKMWCSTSIISRSLLYMWVLRPHQNLMNQDLHFTRILSWFMCILKFEKYSSICCLIITFILRRRLRNGGKKLSLRAICSRLVKHNLIPDSLHPEPIHLICFTVSPNRCLTKNLIIVELTYDSIAFLIPLCTTILAIGMA